MAQWTARGEFQRDYEGCGNAKTLVVGHSPRLYDISGQPGIRTPSLAKLPPIIINLDGHTPPAGNFAEINGALLESVTTPFFPTPTSGSLR
jgi:hypothetical protein